MPVIAIDSPDDPRIAVYRDLKSPQSLRRQPLFIAEGLTLTERLLASPLTTDSVLSEQRFADRVSMQTPPEVPVYVATKQLIKRIAGFDFHRGVLVCGQRPKGRTVADLMRHAPDRLVIAVCVGVQELDNIGGIIRSSAALGVFAVILGPNCADPFARRVGRTSMGANFTTPILESEDLAEDLARLQRDHRVEITATVLTEDAPSLNTASRPERIALLFGNEGYGLAPEWLDGCDRQLSIPMRPGVDSLNVSVAAGIFLHHFAVTPGMRGNENARSRTASPCTDEC